MNKKNIAIKHNINLIANFLKEACDHFKKDGEGCYNFPLSEDLVLAVGWSDGYDMADTDIIKSAGGREERNGWTCGWAVNAGVKIRNDFYCADFDYLDYPWHEDGEVYDSGITLTPNMGKRDYNKIAKWLLTDFVNITNLVNKGKLILD